VDIVNGGPDETKLLIDLLVDAFHGNWCDDNGLINKKKNQSSLDLQRFNSGFGWNHDTKRFTAPDEVWDELLPYLFLWRVESLET
ncbi:hypothetical protein IGI04_025768, partial [Brassica rapa subsp. trilocularis]